jgi:hypothetical protein
MQFLQVSGTPRAVVLNSSCTFASLRKIEKEKKKLGHILAQQL